MVEPVSLESHKDKKFDGVLQLYTVELSTNLSTQRFIVTSHHIGFHLFICHTVCTSSSSILLNSKSDGAVDFQKI